MSAQRVKYDGEYYAVFDVKYKDTKLPVVIDWNTYDTIKKMDKKWKYNNGGYISCKHNGKDIYIHDIVKYINEGESKRIPIIHLNRICLDNRNDNIIYDTGDKEYKKSMKKKKRTIKLPTDCGIEPKDIPTYVWYMKPDKTHGERFVVNIGNINWKTTSSNNILLKDKLEEAKEYLRELKKTDPSIFDEYSMNGDATKKGKELMKSYIKIARRAGYDLDYSIIANNTDKYIGIESDSSD